MCSRLYAPGVARKSCEEMEKAYRTESAARASASTFPACGCPEDRMVIRSYVSSTMDQLRCGYLETMCADCRRVFRYTVGDCYTLRNRRLLRMN